MKILADIAAAGWLVNNLFQRTDRSWQANLYRPGTGGRDFGRGGTPEAALADCIARMGGLVLDTPASDDDLESMLG